MKVKNLLNEIKECKKEYGKEFLEWDVYTEQISKEDKKCKTTGIQKDWKKMKDKEGWEYFECAGFWTKYPKKKIFTININY